jgi:tRNA (guanine-N7-)-methyltransferase
MSDHKILENINTEHKTIDNSTAEQNSTGTTEQYGRNAYAKWLIKLRRGEKPHFMPVNKYLLEATKLEDLLYTLPELTGRFPAPGIFQKPSLPLVLDVGCYFGHTVVELGLHNPGLNVLGLDIRYKRVVKSCWKIQKENLTNAKVAMCDVQALLPVLPEQSTAGIFIFFPDPWMKNRHEKHRYLNEKFFRDVHSRLTDDGFVWLKTDHKDYYEAVAEFAPRNGFTIIDRLPETIARRDYRTIFEGLFTEQKLPIYRLFIRKNK